MQSACKSSRLEPLLEFFRGLAARGSHLDRRVGEELVNDVGDGCAAPLVVAVGGDARSVRLGG